MMAKSVILNNLYRTMRKRYVNMLVFLRYHLSVNGYFVFFSEKSKNLSRIEVLIKCMPWIPDFLHLVSVKMYLNYKS